MILSAISLEIALHYNRTTLGGSGTRVPFAYADPMVFSGWATFYSMNVAPDSTFGNYYHYAYVRSEACI